MSLELLVVMVPGALIAALVCIVVKTSADADRDR